MTFNYIGILTAAVASWVVGGVWYGVLGKQWLAALGKSPEEMGARKMPVGPMILSFVAEIVMATGLASAMVHTGALTPQAGAMTGAACWLAFVVTTVAVNNAYPGRKPMLTIIDSAHWLAVLVVQGLVLGLLGA